MWAPAVTSIATFTGNPRVSDWVVPGSHFATYSPQFVLYGPVCGQRHRWQCSTVHCGHLRGGVPGHDSPGLHETFECLPPHEQSKQ